MTGLHDASSTWVPPVDIYQTGDHELVLKAELPDMTREDIDITVENGTLTIKGEKKFVERGQGGAVPPRRAALRHVQPVVLAAADGRPEQGRGRVQERRADRAAAAARGSQAAADQGRRRRVTSGDRPEGRIGRQVGTGLDRAAFRLSCPSCRSSPRATLYGRSWTTTPNPSNSDRADEPPTIPAEPAPPIESRFLFVDVAALRAKQLRRGARPRFERPRRAAAAQGRARRDGRSAARPGATTTCRRRRSGGAGGRRRGMSVAERRRRADLRRSATLQRPRRRARVFVLVLFIGFCVARRLHEDQEDRRRQRVGRQEPRRADRQPPADGPTCRPTAPRGPADQLEVAGTRWSAAATSR